MPQKLFAIRGVNAVSKQVGLGENPLPPGDTYCGVGGGHGQSRPRPSGPTGAQGSWGNREDVGKQEVEEAEER